MSEAKLPYDEQDCRLIGGEQVIPAGTKSLEDSGWLARLGKADELVDFVHRYRRFAIETLK